MDKAFEISPGVETEVPLSLIDFDPLQPRTNKPDSHINALAESIKARRKKKLRGVKKAVTVRPNPDKPGHFFLVDGECRTRGSRQAKVKTVPALLYVGTDNDLDRYLDQYADNDQQLELTPVEKANFLRRLRDEFGIKSHAKICETLKSHGITGMSESSVSNTIRLLDLPEWAQALISAGTLTAAHGKYLYPAMSSDNVLASIKQVIDGDPDITTKELRDEIYSAYGDHHTQLTNNPYEVKFDYKVECIGKCKNSIRKVLGFAAEDTFCLNDECFDQKNQQAIDDAQDKKEERDAEPKEITISDDNTVDAEEQTLIEGRDYHLIMNAEFDEQECFGCKDCHQVKRTDASGEEKDLQEACFNLECWGGKEADVHKEDERRNQIESSVLHDIARQVSEHVAADYETSVRILAWSTCVPDGIITRDDGESISEGKFPLYIEDDKTLEEMMFSQSLFNLNSFIDAGNDKLQALAAYAVTQLHKDNLLELAKRFEVKPERYRVNDAYLKNKTIAQLCDLLQEANVIDDSLRDEYEKKTLTDLLGICQERDAEMIGLPDEVAEVYREVLED